MLNSEHKVSQKGLVKKTAGDHVTAPNSCSLLLTTILFGKATCYRCLVAGMSIAPKIQRITVWQEVTPQTYRLQWCLLSYQWYSLVMFILNSLTSGFSRVSWFTIQAYVVFRSASSGMNTSLLTPSYKPSSVWIVLDFWGALISLPARIQENVMLGGLKPFAQHSTKLSRPSTTSGEGTKMDGGATNKEKRQLGYHLYLHIHIEKEMLNRIFLSIKVFNCPGDFMCQSIT